MLKPKVLPQRDVHDLDGHGRERPALATNAGAGAARPNVVVVCKIDVEAEFLGDGLEGGLVAEGLAVAGVRGVDGADLEAGGYYVYDVLAEAVASRSVRGALVWKW